MILEMNLLVFHLIKYKKSIIGEKEEIVQEV